jgi:hypothetical protein
LRKIFAENGLPDAWPTICWPGMRQTNFEREAQALAHHLEQTGLSKNVKINLKT